MDINHHQSVTNNHEQRGCVRSRKKFNANRQYSIVEKKEAVVLSDTVVNNLAFALFLFELFDRRLVWYGAWVMGFIIRLLMDRITRVAYTTRVDSVGYVL